MKRITGAATLFSRTMCTDSLWIFSALAAHLLPMRRVHVLDSRAHDFPPKENSVFQMRGTRCTTLEKLGIFHVTKTVIKLHFTVSSNDIHFN